LFNPENYTNFSFYNNPEVLALMEKARGIINPQKRIEMYKDIQNIIIDDCPWIFLYHQQSGIVARDGVLGVNLNSLSRMKFDEIMVESL
jgi:ABC-type transport system substrate-binding protein